MDITRIDLSTLEVGDVLRYTSRVRDIDDPRTLPTSKMPGLLVLSQKLLGWFAKERQEYTKAFRSLLKQKKSLERKLREAIESVQDKERECADLRANLMKAHEALHPSTPLRIVAKVHGASTLPLASSSPCYIWFLQLSAAVMIIQRVWRGHAGRRRFIKMVEALVYGGAPADDSVLESFGFTPHEGSRRGASPAPRPRASPVPVHRSSVTQAAASVTSDAQRTDGGRSGGVRSRRSHDGAGGGHLGGAPASVHDGSHRRRGGSTHSAARAHDEHGSVDCEGIRSGTSQRGAMAQSPVESGLLHDLGPPRAHSTFRPVPSPGQRPGAGSKASAAPASAGSSESAMSVGASATAGSSQRSLLTAGSRSDVGHGHVFAGSTAAVTPQHEPGSRGVPFAEAAVQTVEREFPEPAWGSDVEYYSDYESVGAGGGMAGVRAERRHGWVDQPSAARRGPLRRGNEWSRGERAAAWRDPGGDGESMAGGRRGGTSGNARNSRLTGRASPAAPRSADGSRTVVSVQGRRSAYKGGRSAQERPEGGVERHAVAAAVRNAGDVRPRHGGDSMLSHRGAAAGASVASAGAWATPRPGQTPVAASGRDHLAFHLASPIDTNRVP